jgi:hypothetical protein
VGVTDETVFELFERVVGFERFLGGSENGSIDYGCAIASCE